MDCRATSGDNDKRERASDVAPMLLCRENAAEGIGKCNVPRFTAIRLGRDNQIFVSNAYRGGCSSAMSKITSG